MYRKDRTSLTLIPVFQYTAILSMLMTWMMFAVPAHAEDHKEEVTEVEKFVQEVADTGITKVSDKKNNQSQRAKIMRDILHSSFSVKTIARFSLGQAWRSATKEQQTEYLKLFEEMIIKTYAERFKEYSGQKLQVTGYTPANKYDTVVHSVIIDDSELKSTDNIRVDWRVRSRKGKTRIIDIIVEGISMSITQRSDFESVIQKGGGDIEALLESMRDQMSNK